MTYSDLMLSYAPDFYARFADSGTVLTDASGNSRDGTWGSAVVFGEPGAIAADTGDTSVRLTGDGTNSVGSVPVGAWMNRATFTVGIWFKTTSTAAGYMFQRWPNVASSSCWGLDLTSSNQIRGYARIGGGIRMVAASSAGLRTGVWHLATLTYDGAAAYLHVDGVLVGTGAGGGTLNTTEGWGFSFGVRPDSPTTPFIGSLDEPFFGPPLTTAQILDLFNAGSAAGPSGATGTLSAALPVLSANLAGGIEFSGAVIASLPALAADLVGETYPPGIAGDLSAVLPELSADLAGTSTAPSFSGTLTATLPALRANLVGQAFGTGTEGYIEALLPALSASLSGDVLGRNGLGLILDSSAVLTVDAPLEPAPPVPAGTPSTVLHIIAPTVPVPTLVAGRPS